MTRSPLSDYVRLSKYALYLKDRGRRETWSEQVARVFDMHGVKYANLVDALRPYVDHARAAMDDLRALGSQRALQFGGRPVLKKNQRMYNCTVSHCNRPRFFQEAFHLLLCGCGVGFSVQRHHVARLPKVAIPTGPEAVYQIPDTIEGWADAYGVLLSSYFTDDQPFPEYAGRPVTFDASLVRPKGAPISSGSKAPGPEPLLRALEAARLLLDRVVAPKGAEVGYRRISEELAVPVVGMGRNTLRPVDAFDLVMHAADAVLSGGVRRSATIAVFSADDVDMIEAKATPRWWDLEPQRMRANISAVLLRRSTDFDTFADLIERTKRWGEPGFVFTDDLEQMFNPCGEAGMWPCLEVGHVDCGRLLPGTRSGVEFRNGTVRVPGWQMCNLSTIIGSRCDTPEAFFDACRAAATLGSLQAGYTDFAYLGWVSEAIVRHEALLGVSVTGMMDQPEILFDPEVLERGAAIVKTTNEEVAAIIGINPGARTTLIKPEGKSSLVADTLAAGIHPWPARRGIRHVRASVMEGPFQHFKAANPHAVYQLASSDPNRDNTEVIAFPFEAPPGALTAEDVGALDLLERVILVRRHWIEPGTRPERCTRGWLRHNVSNTITVPPDQWGEVTRFIFENRVHFSGVALLPESGDKFYDLAPHVSVRTPDEQVDVHGEGAVLEARALVEDCPASFGGLWAACAVVVNGNGGQHPPDEEAWMAAFESLAHVHFGGALRAAEVCVKDVECWDRFVTLRATMASVEWEAMDEVTDNVDFVASSGACDGQKCEIDFSTFEGHAK